LPKFQVFWDISRVDW